MKKFNLLNQGETYVSPECEALQFELEQNILNASTESLPDMQGEDW